MPVVVLERAMSLDRISVFNDNSTSTLVPAGTSALVLAGTSAVIPASTSALVPAGSAGGRVFPVVSKFFKWGHSSSPSDSNVPLEELRSNASVRGRSRPAKKNGKDWRRFGENQARVLPASAGGTAFAS